MGNAIATLRPGDHVCLAAASDAEWFDAAVTLTAGGLRDHCKTILVTTIQPVERLHRRLAERVPGYPAAAVAGHVEIAAGRELYLSGGGFDGDRMIGIYAAAIDDSQQRGYAGLRVIADMAWAADQPLGERLADYETAVNRLFTTGWMAAICQYDRRLFDDATIEGVCSAHPIIDNGAAFRFRAVEEPPGLVLTGDLHRSNRRVLAEVLAPLADVPAALTIDATGVTFVGPEAAVMLVSLARLRREQAQTTTVVCAYGLGALLWKFDSTGALTTRGPSAHD
ncbi:hypothetical protein GCM10010399_28350 [Dactylosporangium fulvum]|uniref:MEDS domain-containing protein n=1 Tax=Dactylosporangium fulvum TaxID=53359 RepID=A0ABY5W9Q3_9ACTN|nr:MEDS domain-containing protein [Dactylosporangium fulvum]UWP86292.1 MEDS domain-containing protein [Dactylosporangium fulvum]